MNGPRTEPDPLGDLVGRAQAGDPEAFRQLVRRIHGRIHRWALVRTGEPDDADDVVQTVLLRLHRGIGAFRGGGRLTSWLYRVTANAAEELRRKRSRRARLLDERGEPRERSVEPDGARSLDDTRLARLVRERFFELPGRQREVFDLVDLQGYSPAEVADMLGLERVTVRTNLLRARRALRRRILESHPELVEAYRS